MTGCLAGGMLGNRFGHDKWDTISGLFFGAVGARGLEEYHRERSEQGWEEQDRYKSGKGERKGIELVNSAKSLALGTIGGVVVGALVHEYGKMQTEEREKERQAEEEDEEREESYRKGDRKGRDRRTRNSGGFVDGVKDKVRGFLGCE